MNIFLSYIVFVSVFMAVGYIVLITIEKLIIFSYQQLKEFFFPTPQIPEDVYEQICKEASDFVWAKHRPWSYDDTFAEYMCLVNDMCIDKWNELYGDKIV
jgi:hypothetical protein